jgi:hypothetical protein
MDKEEISSWILMERIFPPISRKFVLFKFH